MNAIKEFVYQIIFCELFGIFGTITTQFTAPIFFANFLGFSEQLLPNLLHQSFLRTFWVFSKGKNLKSSMYTCDRCGNRYSMVSWKSWVVNTPFYMCEKCWDSFYRMIPYHPHFSCLVRSLHEKKGSPTSHPRNLEKYFSWKKLSLSNNK